MSNRLVPNPNVPQIPTPVANLGALVYVCQTLKQAVDSLAGNRGNVLGRAVTFNDLIAMGLASATQVSSPAPPLPQSEIPASTVPTTPFGVIADIQTKDFTPSVSEQVYPIDSSTGPVTVTLPAAPPWGTGWAFIDVGGAAATHNITVSAGSSNITGSPTLVLSVNYSFVSLIYLGVWVQFAT